MALTVNQAVQLTPSHTAVVKAALHVMILDGPAQLSWRPSAASAGHLATLRPVDRDAMVWPDGLDQQGLVLEAPGLHRGNFIRYVSVSYVPP
jgi:hypothetical protein